MELASLFQLVNCLQFVSATCHRPAKITDSLVATSFTTNLVQLVDKLARSLLRTYLVERFLRVYFAPYFRMPTRTLWSKL